MLHRSGCAQGNDVKSGLADGRQGSQARGLGWPQARTPEPAIIILNNALKRASEDPKYKTALQAGGYAPASSSPEEFRAFLEQNISDWKQAARAAGITPNWHHVGRMISAASVLCHLCTHA
jgi:hypothetical protein